MLICKKCEHSKDETQWIVQLINFKQKLIKSIKNLNTSQFGPVKWKSDNILQQQSKTESYQRIYSHTP